MERPLLLPVMRHPKVPLHGGLHRGRVVLGIIGVLIFVLTFTLTPFYDNSLLEILHVDLLHQH